MAGGLWVSNHTGLDFAAPTGTPIVAVATGTITETGWAGSYGNRTIETLKDGTEIWYAHQSVISVHEGEAVRGGQQIGNIGSTGNTYSGGATGSSTAGACRNASARAAATRSTPTPPWSTTACTRSRL